MSLEESLQSSVLSNQAPHLPLGPQMWRGKFKKALVKQETLSFVCGCHFCYVFTNPVLLKLFAAQLVQEQFYWWRLSPPSHLCMCHTIPPEGLGSIACYLGLSIMSFQPKNVIIDLPHNHPRSVSRYMKISTPQLRQALIISSLYYITFV
jgi:hypothetical protein